MNGSGLALLLAAILGGVIGLGVVVVAAGLFGRVLVQPGRVATRAGRFTDRLLLRCALALVGGVVGYAITRWPVVGLMCAAGGAWFPSARAASGRSAGEIAKVEAIATWTEQLRDTLSAASGLQSALVATAGLAPAPIGPAVGRLGARIEYERTGDALRRFAEDVDHPVADFVVAALLVASEHEARDLVGLLGQLATTARDEARLRSRVWVGRARTRTSVRVIAAVIPLMVGAVMLLDRHYLDPYNSAGGQVALLAVGAVFLGSFAGMERMGRIRLPERFLARRIPAAVGR